MFRIDWKALRSGPGLVMVAALFVTGLVMVTFTDSLRKPQYIQKASVWVVVQEEARKQDLDPHFVFAVIAAESSFNAHAENGDARGLMQLRPPAWETVSENPHSDAWIWRENIRAGVAYLAHLRAYLERHDQFSYPMLAACYRYGPNRVRRAGFDLKALPPTRNKIYQALDRGEVSPVPPPV